MNVLLYTRREEIEDQQSEEMVYVDSNYLGWGGYIIEFILKIVTRCSILGIIFLWMLYICEWSSVNMVLEYIWKWTQGTLLFNVRRGGSGYVVWKILNSTKEVIE